MAVDIYGHADFTVSKEFLHDFWMDAHAQQDRCSTVAQIMKAHMWETRFFDQFVEYSQGVAGVEIASIDITENEIMLLPC